MISSLIISQNNLNEGFLSLSIHNPLVFLCDAVFDGATPEYIICEIHIEGESIGEFRCVPLEYVLETRVTYLLKADSIIRAYMEKFDDVETSIGILESMPQFTKSVKLIFKDPDNNAANKEVDFIAVHANRGIGENPCLTSIESNEPDTYYSWGSHPCYVYFFNNDISNSLSLNTEDQQVMLDYDDVELSDFDDQLLTANF